MCFSTSGSSKLINNVAFNFTICTQSYVTLDVSVWLLLIRGMLEFPLSLKNGFETDLLGYLSCLIISFITLPPLSDQEESVHRFIKKWNSCQGIVGGEVYIRSRDGHLSLWLSPCTTHGGFAQRVLGSFLRPACNRTHRARVVTVSHHRRDLHCVRVPNSRTPGDWYYSLSGWLILTVGLAQYRAT